MCVWDGTYIAPEAEREALDQVPGWKDDTALTLRRHAKPRQRARDRRESSGPALRVAS